MMALDCEKRLRRKQRTTLASPRGMLDRVNAHRRQLINPKIAVHRGRIVKTTGDGLLVEFASAGGAQSL